ncbi:sulfotransferase 1 family member D1-like isoform X1 [Lissotriton helveticus]
MDVSPALAVDEYVTFRGTIMVKSMVENFPRVEEFEARPDDVLIATYPKAGTTWLSEIVDMIYQDGDAKKCSRDTIFNRVPYLEICAPGMPPGVEQLAALPSPRLIKTHLPVHLIPESFWKNNCKILYMARNAKDVAVSFYFFQMAVKLLPPIKMWAEFLEKYMAGEVSYGLWHDHVKGWWEKRDDPCVLYLFYEDMKEDPIREIRKVARFLKKDLEEEVLEKIIRLTSFKSMKDNPMANYSTLPQAFLDHSISPFMRKGVAGDWKNYFTVAQNERFKENYARHMEGSLLSFRDEI